jgi:uncharacterized membrane protein
VILPLAAFAVLLLADLGFLLSALPVCSECAVGALALGLLTALPSVAIGLADASYFARSTVARAAGALRSFLAVVALALLGVSLYLRSRPDGFPFRPSPTALALSFLALALLALQTWLGAGVVVLRRAVASAPGPGLPEQG